MSRSLLRIVSALVSWFRSSPHSDIDRIANFETRNDTRKQYVASVLSIPKFAKRRYRDVANFGIGTLAVLAIAVPAFAQVPELSVSGAKTADYLQQCERDRNLCRDFTNNVLQIMTAAASLGQAKLYKGCAVLPLNADDTGKLIEQIRTRPQAPGAYASDDIARAAEYLWPCK